MTPRVQMHIEFNISPIIEVFKISILINMFLHLYSHLYIWFDMVHVSA